MKIILLSLVKLIIILDLTQNTQTMKLLFIEAPTRQEQKYSQLIPM